MNIHQRRTEFQQYIFPLASVIVPVFNAEKYIENCIIRTLEQSYENLEMILVDDGSRDQSGIICDEYAKKDSRIKVIHQKNQGVSAARNIGLQQAKGDFITFVDADDEIPENYLYELVKTQKDTKTEIVVCDVAVFCDKAETRRFTYAESVLTKNLALNFLLSRKYINSGPCAKLFSAKILSGIQFPALQVYEDILFVRDVFDKSEKIAFTNKTEYKYLQNAESAMGKNRKNPSKDIIKATKDIIQFLNHHRELDPYCFYITLSHLMQYVQMIQENRDKNDIEQANFLNEAKKVFWKCKYQILFCRAFPWKEKLFFLWTALKK